MNYTLFREARMRKGLSQKELADKIGKYPPYIVDIELGRRDLRISNIEKLCEALDLEINIKPKTNNMSQLPQTNNEEKYDVEEDLFLRPKPMLKTTDLPVCSRI